MTLWNKIRTAIYPDRSELEQKANPAKLEAERARLEAERALRAAQKRTPEVENLASSLREARERNGFGEAVELAMLRKV